MLSTGNMSTQIMDNRKRIRDTNGEAVKISNEKDTVYDKKCNYIGVV